MKSISFIHMKFVIPKNDTGQVKRTTFCSPVEYGVRPCIRAASVVPLHLHSAARGKVGQPGGQA